MTSSRQTDKTEHDPACPEADARWRRLFRRRLLNWYDDVARDLPWRRTTDPYRVWISEIMLQQTTVAAVIPYYERFLDRFPTVSELADADEADVLKLWEGLGYYSRARNLRRAAIVVRDEYAGTWPREPQELQALPGIGRYTAGAIASFAFDLPAPIVEANTARLYARLTGYDVPIKSTAGQRRLWSFAEQMQPRKGSGRFNQALMELGGTVCKPKSPHCGDCPAADLCVGFQDGRQHEIPVVGKRPEMTDVVESYIAIALAGRYLLRRREPHERWAGLWDFPRYTLAEGDADYRPTAADLTRLSRAVLTDFHINIELGDVFKEIRHGVTRYRMRVLCFAATVKHDVGTACDDVRWAAPGEMASLGMPVPGRQLADALTHSLALTWDAES